MKYENQSTDIGLVLELYKVPCLVNRCRIATEFFVKVSIQCQMDICYAPTSTKRTKQMVFSMKTSEFKAVYRKTRQFIRRFKTKVLPTCVGS